MWQAILSVAVVALASWWLPPLLPLSSLMWFLPIIFILIVLTCVPLRGEHAWNGFRQETSQELAVPGETTHKWTRSATHRGPKTGRLSRWWHCRETHDGAPGLWQDSAEGKTVVLIGAKWMRDFRDNGKNVLEKFWHCFYSSTVWKSQYNLTAIMIQGSRACQRD